MLRSLFQSKIKARCPVLILDLSGVDFIDSTRLAAVVEYFRDAAEYEGILCLTGLNETLKAIFEVVNLDKAIPIFASTLAAKIALKEGRVPSDQAAFEPKVSHLKRRSLIADFRSRNFCGIFLRTVRLLARVRCIYLL